ncbi:MAG: hypothetical protein ACOX4H_02150 [Bacillota bacterium]|jgi:hypothetical protein
MNSMIDEEKNKVNEKENRNNSETLFDDSNILDRSKRSLAKLSWFQKLFK